MKVSLWPGSRFKPEACQGCPLEKRGQGFVPGYGDLNCRVLVLGERPGKCEAGVCDCSVATHPRLQPFVGKSGRKIDVGFGDSRDGLFITNVRKCFYAGEGKAERRESIHHCVRAFLLPELEAIGKAQSEAARKRASMVCVGSDATKLILGRGSMQKFHAAVFTREEAEAMSQAAEALEGGDENEEMDEPQD